MRDHNVDVSVVQTPITPQDNGETIAKRMKERALAAKARKAPGKGGEGEDSKEGEGALGEEGQRSKEEWDGVS